MTTINSTITIKDAEGKKVTGTVTSVGDARYGRFVLTTKEGFELDCNNDNCTILTNKFYFDSYTENHVEVNRKNGKMRILDENNNFRPYTRFQEVKECEDTCEYYVIKDGEKWIVNMPYNDYMVEIPNPNQ